VRLNSPGLEGWLATDGRTLFMTVLNTAAPLASAATSANAAAVGTALDGVRQTATGDLRDVTREMAALDDRSLDAALDQVAGEIHGTALQLTALDAEAAADLVRGEVAGRRVHLPAITGEFGSGSANAEFGSIRAWGAGRRWWGRFLGQRATLDSTGVAQEARGHLGGFALGVDGTRGAWMFGGGGGYALGELTLSGSDSVETTAPRVFGYAGYGRGRWTTQVGSSLSRPSYRTERAIAFTARLDPRFGNRALFGSGVDRAAEADVRGLDTAVWLDTQATVTRGAWLLQPALGMRTARYARSAWTETGAGALSLIAPDQAITSTQADATFRLTRAGGSFRPYGSATYRRELGSGLTRTTLQLSPAGAFDVHGLALAGDRIIGNVGMTAAAGMSFGYRIDSGGGQVRHAVDVGVRFD
jgi:outer membrane autotransporter protein